MSYTGSFYKAATKFSLLATTVLSGLLAFSALPESPVRIAPPETEQRSASVEIANEVNGEVVLAVALASSAAIGVGLTALVERDRASYGGSSSSRRLPSNQTTTQPTALNFAQVSRSLQRKLLRLLHEDRGAAHRLFVHASLKYPGHHPDWYAEKIIYDLVRDRGKY